MAKHTGKSVEDVEKDTDRDYYLSAKEAAEYTKQEQILLGQGEAERKRLNMKADGALHPKLATYERVNAMYAKAMAEYKGDWVPKVQMGAIAGGGGNASGAQAMIDMLTIKTAKELALDMSITK